MNRPVPPSSLLELSELSDFGIRLTPAPEVWEWLQAEILSGTGSIHNEDHAHLLDAGIRIMWASSSFEKQGRTVLGQAEQVAFRAGDWQKARMEQQMRDWFGDVPAFITTLAADYCAQCSDADFCALIEHELYHIALLAIGISAVSSRKRLRVSWNRVTHFFARLTPDRLVGCPR